MIGLSGAATCTALYTWDPSGSLAQRVNTGGGIIDSAVSDGFGRGATTDGTADPFSGFGGQWGGYTDAQDGLTLFTHRFYDAGTGRFLTRDPMGYAGGINLYAYTGNSPICSADPSGFGVVYLGVNGTGGSTLTAQGGGGIAIQFPGFGTNGGWNFEFYGTIGTGLGFGAVEGVSGNIGLGYGDFTGFNGPSQYYGGSIGGDGGSYQTNDNYYGVQVDAGIGEGAAFGFGNSTTYGTAGSGSGAGSASSGSGGGTGSAGAGVGSGGASYGPLGGAMGGGAGMGPGLTQAIRQIISQAVHSNPSTVSW